MGRPGRLWLPLLVWVAVGVAVTCGRPHPEPPRWPSYADAFDAVAPGVVNVHLSSGGRLGTGFVVSERDVVTAWHLVDGAEAVQVRDLDGQVRTARVVGTDARLDLALLRLEGEPLPPLSLGRSVDLRVGETVLAVGNPYGLGHTLSVGIVAHRGRQLAADAAPRVDFLQLSIPLNPGNSGGPVVDREGRVVGVLTGTHTTGQAIAFAVPVEVLQGALPALMRGERVSRAFLGVRTERVGDSVRVVSVIPSSPADRAGIRAGDALTAVDNEGIDSPEALQRVLDRLTGGESVSVRLLRDGQLVLADVTLADWAEQPMVVSGMTLRPRPGSGGDVVAVRPRSLAERAGVEVGDVVRAINGVPVHAPAEVKDALSNADVARLELVRDGVSLEVQLR